MKKEGKSKVFRGFGRNDYDRAMEINFSKNQIFGLNNSCKILRKINSKSHRFNYYSPGENIDNAASVTYIDEFKYFVGGFKMYLLFVSMKSSKKKLIKHKASQFIHSMAYNRKNSFLFTISGNSLNVFKFDKTILPVFSMVLNFRHYSLRIMGNNQGVLACGGNKNCEIIKRVV